jgi:replicative DNA helicase
LDNKTQGLQKKELVVIGGAPSMGKTALAQGIAEHAAGNGNNVLFFSLEMSTEQLFMRSMAADTRIPLQQVRGANFDEEKWSSMYRGAQKIAGMNLWTDDCAGQDFGTITRKIKKMKRKEGLDLVIIDYLQIMGYNKRFEKEELDVITAGLKNLAKSEDICIILLSQLNREGYKPPRDGSPARMPCMSDLRASGQIEANADVVLFPWRPAASCELCAKGTVTSDHDPEIHRHEAAVKIGKQRQGENNIVVDLLWMPEQTRFKDLARMPE